MNPLLPDSAVDERDLDASFSVLAFMMNRAVVDQMLRSARRFGGDFEALMIWGVLAHQNVAHLLPLGRLLPALMDEQGYPATLQQEIKPILLRDVAQITGIPRETVRRKLEWLKTQGWLLKTSKGWLLNLETVDPGLREFTKGNIRRFLATAEAMHQTIAQARASRPPGAK